eukprot:SAG22_NODE_5383_length_1024_cov_1.185946_1_plen_251_part_01
MATLEAVWAAPAGRKGEARAAFFADMLAVNPRAPATWRGLPLSVAVFNDPLAASSGFVDAAQREALVGGAVALGDHYAKAWNYRKWNYQKGLEAAAASSPSGAQPGAAAGGGSSSGSAGGWCGASAASAVVAAAAAAGSKPTDVAATTTTGTCLDCDKSGRQGRVDTDGEFYCNGCWAAWANAGIANGSHSPSKLLRQQHERRERERQQRKAAETLAARARLGSAGRRRPKPRLRSAGPTRRQPAATADGS